MLRVVGISLAAGIFIFVVVLFVLMLRQSVPATKQDQPNNSAQTQSEEEYSENKSGETIWQRTTRDPVAFFTFWLAIFTFALVGISAIQIGFLLEAERTATAQSKTATDALHTSQRPWVLAEVVETFKGTIDDSIYCRVGYKVHMKNSGTSVARSVIYNSRAIKFPPTWDWLAARVEVLKTETINLWSAKRPAGLPVGVVLAPGQTISPIRCPAYADGNDPTDAQIATGAFLVIGYIQYTDQFDRVHHTRFAFSTDSDSVRPWDGKSFVVYNDYQDAD